MKTGAGIARPPIGEKMNETTISPAVTRRQFLNQALTAAAMATAGPWALSACGGGGNQEPQLEYKIAQMLMVGFRGTQLTDSDPIVRDIRDYGLGGAILFDYDMVLRQYGRNITSPAQLRALTAQLQSYATDQPLFIAVDQEGGRVVRLKERYGFPATVSAQYLGSCNDLELTRRYAFSMADTLAENGLNVNFAPVVDLNVNPDNPVIGQLGRSFSADPDVVMAHSWEMIRAHDYNWTDTCLKHFPGHGSSTGDSHMGFVDVTDTWSEIELEPYRGLIRQGRCRMVMTAHIFNARLDPIYPATLSSAIITGILREKIGFDGVIVTDDMQMGAIEQHYSFDHAIERAIAAGADIIVIGNNLRYEPDIVPDTIALIRNLVYAGAISEQRIDQSYARIMAMKALMHAESLEMPGEYE